MVEQLINKTLYRPWYHVSPNEDPNTDFRPIVNCTVSSRSCYSLNVCDQTSIIASGRVAPRDSGIRGVRLTNLRGYLKLRGREPATRSPYSEVVQELSFARFGNNEDSCICQRLEVLEFQVV
jgi:hypothetical protein